MSDSPQYPPAKAYSPAAFLDRDGVVIRDHGYVYRRADLEILPGVFEGLRLMKARGYLLILVSNQSGVARGMFSRSDVEAFHLALQEQIEAACGWGLDGIYFCPHHPQGKIPEFARECACRKPGIGMLQQARRDFAIAWDRSIMVGDRDSDIECAHAAGIRGIQLGSDQYEEHRSPDGRIRRLDEIGPFLSP